MTKDNSHYSSYNLPIVKNGKLYQGSDRKSIKSVVKEVLETSPITCTYFGEVFDIPFLRKDFKTKLELAHIDLCFWTTKSSLSAVL